MISEEQKNRLKGVGVDFDATLERFCDNQEMYIKFLKKFETDKCYSNALQALNSDNFVELLEQVHALKGLSGNLGIDSIYDICSDIVIELRADRKDEIASLMERLDIEYKAAVECISEL